MGTGDGTCVCGVLAPGSTGAVDPYQAATPGCWALFGRLVAGDYAAWQPRRHRLTVDAYMAQHPGLGSAAGRRSVLVHLVGLWLTLERGMTPREVGPLLGLVFPNKRTAPPEVTPSPALSGINVTHVLGAEPEAHDARVEAWARFVWNAWQPQHALVRELAEAAMLRPIRAERR